MTTMKNATLSIALLATLGLCGSAFAQGTGSRGDNTGTPPQDTRQTEQRSDNAAKGPVRPVLKSNARVGTEVQSDIHAGHQMEQTSGAANANDRAREQSASGSAVSGTADTTTRATVPASANAASNARIATSAPGAMAAERHVSGAGRFHLDTALLDTNRDGFLTTTEVASNQTLTQHFAAIDTDRDSRLAADELRTWIRAGGLSMHQRPEGRDFERGQRTRRVTSR